EFDPLVGRGLDDPEVRRAAIDELVAQSGTGWDSFADPAVGRLLQPRIKNFKITGMSVSTNDYGMREPHYALPKPDRTVRVVILGDSFVMGQGVDAQVRLGAHLERFLRMRGGVAARRAIECLHFGLDGWNTLAEATWMRRQLGLVKPDLVVQVLVRNDLEDNP